MLLFAEKCLVSIECHHGGPSGGSTEQNLGQQGHCIFGGHSANWSAVVMFVGVWWKRLSVRLVVAALLFASVDAATAQVRPLGGPTAIPLGVTPLPVTRFCRQRARRGKFAVLCPTRYPRTPSSDATASGSSLLGPSFYWASFNDAAGFDDGVNGHLILGGQRPPFSLMGSPGQIWPRPGQPHPVEQLPLPRLLTTPGQDGRRFVAQRPARILGRARVRAQDALILVAPPYP